MKIFVILAIFSYVNFCTSEDYEYGEYEEEEKGQNEVEEVGEVEEDEGGGRMGYDVILIEMEDEPNIKVDRWLLLLHYMM